MHECYLFALFQCTVNVMVENPHLSLSLSLRWFFVQIFSKLRQRNLFLLLVCWYISERNCVNSKTHTELFAQMLQYFLYGLSNIQQTGFFIVTLVNFGKKTTTFLHIFTPSKWDLEMSSFFLLLYINPLKICVIFKFFFIILFNLVWYDMRVKFFVDAMWGFANQFYFEVNPRGFMPLGSKREG